MYFSEISLKIVINNGRTYFLGNSHVGEMIGVHHCKWIFFFTRKIKSYDDKICEFLSWSVILGNE